MPGRIDLPTFYYHDHFMEMLQFVQRVYGHCLGPAEHDFLRRFAGLLVEEQCLFIRMMNRKSAVFSQKQLRYPELAAPQRLGERLIAAGFAAPAAPEDYTACLLTMPKAALAALCDQIGVAQKSGWDKNRLAAEIAARQPFEDFAAAQEPFLRPLFRAEAGYLRYLCFGKTQDNLSGFALRDLGLLRVQERVDYAARFHDEAEARDSFYYLQLAEAARTASPPEKEALADALLLKPAPAAAFARNLRDAALLKLGQHFERLKEHDRALALYGLAEGGAARERFVRLAYAAGRHEQVEALLERMIADPASDDEYAFAEDFYARKYGQRRIGAHTALLRAAEEIFVDDIYRGSPEQGAIDRLSRAGAAAFHAENHFWVTLFALLFWAPLFESASSSTGLFDHYPAVLRQNKFAALFEREIAGVTAALRQGGAQEIVAATIAEKYGAPNGLFYWTEDLAAYFDAILAVMPAAPLADIIGRMAADFEAMSSGFPDLIVLQGGALQLVEIKGEGDQIQRHQLTRIRQLQSAGFDVAIRKVGYRFDPEQTYVVVDVETTGGRAGPDRVTEIGAVKIRGGKIIAEWQSLVNPGRPIPAFITELTGITDEMVEDAPRFEDIAAEFRAFLEGGIFAAHNVNFDYGFLSAEFGRLEQGFRYPKICTCAGMRRHYPGHGSYSLGLISREYGIPLKNHHRALADAHAAAGLLLLINEKRAETAQLGAVAEG